MSDCVGVLYTSVVKGYIHDCSMCNSSAIDGALVEKTFNDSYPFQSFYENLTDRLCPNSDIFNEGNWTVHTISRPAQYYTRCRMDLFMDQNIVLTVAMCRDACINNPDCAGLLYYQAIENSIGCSGCNITVVKDMQLQSNIVYRFENLTSGLESDVDLTTYVVCNPWTKYYDATIRKGCRTFSASLNTEDCKNDCINNETCSMIYVYAPGGIFKYCKLCDTGPGQIVNVEFTTVYAINRQCSPPGAVCGRIL